MLRNRYSYDDRIMIWFGSVFHVHVVLQFSYLLFSKNLSYWICYFLKHSDPISYITNVSIHSLKTDHTINYRSYDHIKTMNYSYATCLTRWWEKLSYRGDDCSKKWFDNALSKSKIFSRSVIIVLQLFPSFKAERIFQTWNNFLCKSWILSLKELLSYISFRH